MAVAEVGATVSGLVVVVGRTGATGGVVPVFLAVILGAVPGAALGLFCLPVVAGVPGAAVVPAAVARLVAVVGITGCEALRFC